MSQEFHTEEWPLWVRLMYHAQSYAELDKIVCGFINAYDKDTCRNEMIRELHQLRRAAERTTS